MNPETLVWKASYSSPVDRDRLFVATVDWLDGVVKAPDEHQLLLASGRLRLLLLDDSRLVDQVNRSRRFQIRFRILRHRESPPFPDLLTLWALPDGLSPGHVPPNHTIPVESVPREAFLHERIMIYRGEDVTVAELISHTANVVGGVHAGASRTDKQQKLDDLGEEISISGMHPGIRCIRGIAAVVVEALHPLRDAIVAGG